MIIFPGKEMPRSDASEVRCLLCDPPDESANHEHDCFNALPDQPGFFVVIIIQIIIIPWFQVP